MSEDKDSVKKNVRGSLSSLKPELVIGTRVKVQMINNNEAEGEIFTLDDTAGMLVLTESMVHTTLKKNVRFISFSAIESVEIITPSDGAALSQLQPISEEQLLRAERRNLAARREANARIGVGVTQEAQQIFDVLCRTLPCQWDDQNIIVLNTVTIEPPYTADSCSSSDSNALERIRKVLEGAKKKLSQQKKKPAK